MSEAKEIVMNTGPIIALVAALGDLSVLQSLYSRVLVPYEVCREVCAGGSSGFAVEEFEKADWLRRWPEQLHLSPYIRNSLDIGEASVIQLALNEGVNTVCIDEAVGRRVARLNELSLTGSLGILLRAKREGYPLDLVVAIRRMKERGIWLSKSVEAFVLSQI